MIRLSEVIASYRKNVLEYDYVAANKTLMNFMVNELSSYYCDFTKDILYCDEENSLRRRQVQSVYWNCTDALVRMWAPFLCYTAEEVWTHFSNNEEPSVHYTSYPEAQEYPDAAELREEFAALLKVRDAVNKSIENARNDKLIGTAQEACVTLHCTDADKELLEGTLKEAAAQWMIVSGVVVSEGEGAPEISRAEGTKCPRCWNYSETPDENDLCPRCHDVMAKLISR
jgi:isoleucyl-tRNA synthetase